MTDRVRALTYLAAAELVRGGRDSATAALERLVILDPRYQVDQLVFPPEVTSLFAVVRRQTKAVTVQVESESEIHGTAAFTPVLYATSFHQISAEIRRLDGPPVRLLYQGVIGDSLALRWNGRDSLGVLADSGSYLLTVRSSGPDGSLVRIVQLPLELTIRRPDTLVHPVLPAESLLVEVEERHRSPVVVAAGLLSGAAIALLPAAVAPEADLSGAQYAVGGAVSLSGLLSFFALPTQRTIRENRAANEAFRARWQVGVDRILRENAARRADIRVVIRAGVPQTVEVGR